MTTTGHWIPPQDWMSEMGNKAGNAANPWYGLFAPGWLDEWAAQANNRGKDGWFRCRTKLRKLAIAAVEGCDSKWRVVQRLRAAQAQGERGRRAAAAVAAAVASRRGEGRARAQFAGQSTTPASTRWTV